MNYTTVPRTTFITNFIALGLDTTYLKYHHSGFLTLQALVDEYAFELAGGDAEGRPVRAPATYAVGVPMPTPPYSQNIFYQAVGFLLGLVMTMCQLYPVAQLGKVVVEEKERRLRQTMRIMGCRAASSSVVARRPLCSSRSTRSSARGDLTLLRQHALLGAAALRDHLLHGVHLVGAAAERLLLERQARRHRAADRLLRGAAEVHLLRHQPLREDAREARLVAATAVGLLVCADILADYEYAQVGVSPANWTTATTRSCRAS